MSEQAPVTADAAEQAFYEEAAAADPVAEEGANGAEPEVAAEPEPQEQEQEKVQKVVPLAALHEERAKAKRMRDELNALHEQTRVGNERLNQLYQAMQQAQAQKLPDLEADPVNNLDMRQRAIEQALQQQNQVLAHTQAERQREAAIAQLTNHVSAQEREYVAQAPDYHKALEHLKSTEVRALVALGHDEQQAAAIVHNNFGSMAWQMAQRGENIPERVYELAKARGYTNQTVNPQGQQRIATAQKGVAASKSLGSGAGTTNNLTLESLASLPAEEFAEMTKDPKVWRRMMGG